METAGEGSTDPRHGREGLAALLPDAWFRLHRARRVQVVVLSVLTVLALPLLVASQRSGGDDGASGPGQSRAAQYVADLPRSEVATWDRLAQCESSGDWSADTGNGFFGGLQFTQSSWEMVGGTGNPADASRNEQIMRADMLEQEQGWTAWPVCSQKLGLD